jgi:hypothetical protein
LLRCKVEGRNLAFEHHSSEQYEALAALATSIVARGVAAIFTVSNLNAAQAARGQPTSAILPRRLKRGRRHETSPP